MSPRRVPVGQVDDVVIEYTLIYGGRGYDAGANAHVRRPRPVHAPGRITNTELSELGAMPSEGAARGRAARTRARSAHGAASRPPRE